MVHHFDESFDDHHHPHLHHPTISSNSRFSDHHQLPPPHHPHPHHYPLDPSSSSSFAAATANNLASSSSSSSSSSPSYLDQSYPQHHQHHHHHTIDSIPDLDDLDDLAHFELDNQSQVPNRPHGSRNSRRPERRQSRGGVARSIDHSSSATSERRRVEECTPPTPLEDQEEEEDEDEDEDQDGEDSLIHASKEEVERRALSILGLDREGRVLPLSSEQETFSNSLWTRAGTCDLPPQPTAIPTTMNSSASSTAQQQHFSLFNHLKPIDPDSSLAPTWIRTLRSNVLISPPSNPDEETQLFESIKKNLYAIVNNLSEDQWRYPSPPAFLPSSTILSAHTRGNLEELVGAGHEAYLEQHFNPLSQLSSSTADPTTSRRGHHRHSSSSSSSTSSSPRPPRELWLGEDEDDGLDSEVSLIDLLNATPAHPPNHAPHPSSSSSDSSRLSPAWSFSNRLRPHPHHHHPHHHRADRSSTTTFIRPNAHPGSSLARQVSRLGMSE